MRCGAFGSWHCGQRLVAAARSASWVRRLAVRVFECRRLGFGMVMRPAVLSLFQLFERCQPRVLPHRRAIARPRIQVRAALRAKAFAILAAERLHRQREIKLLAHQLAEINLIVGVIARFEIFFRYLPVLLGRRLRRWQIAVIEVRIDRKPVRLDTAAARELELGPDMPYEAEPVLVLEDVELEFDGGHNQIRVRLTADFLGLERPDKMADRLAVASEIELHGPTLAKISL